MFNFNGRIQSRNLILGMVTSLLWLCALAPVILADDTGDFTYKSPVAPAGQYLAENFDNLDAFNDKWVISKAMKDGELKYNGEIKIEPASGDHLQGDLGLVLKNKARHYGMSTQLTRPFVFEGKSLIVQYEVQFQNGMECGGAYLKLLAEPSQQSVADMMANFDDKTLYSIMFGPDKCGTTQKLHLIFQHKNPKTGVFTEKHWKHAHNANNAMRGKFAEVFTDKKPHQYTLILNPDNTFEIKIDGRSESKGSLLEDFDPPVNPEKEIDDLEDKRPEDWDERENIPDPSATKPEDWDEDEPREIQDPSAVKPVGWLDDEPENIPDPTAVKPADWDEDMDGVWEAPLITNSACASVGCGKWQAPMVTNPKYKGKWRAPTISNPAYKGKWKPRRIPNPDYFEDLSPYRLRPIHAVGFELWTITDSILFDNLLITDDSAVASQWSEDGFLMKKKVLEKDSESFIGSWFATFVDYSTQYPWLWAVYVLVVGVPVALLISYCCMSKTPKPDDEPARRKKSDLEELPEEDEVEQEEGQGDDQENQLEEENTPDIVEIVDEKVEEPEEEEMPKVSESGDEPKVVKRKKAKKV